MAMLNRILSLIGWLGTALVFVAVAIRFGFPAKEQYAYYLAWAGLVCVLLYIARPVARNREGVLAAPGALRHARRPPASWSCSAFWSRSTTSALEQNKRWDLTANKQFSLSDQTRNVLAKLDSPLQVQVFAQEPEFARYQDKLKEYEYVTKKVTAEYIDPDKKPTVAKAASVQQYGTIIFNYKGRSERITSRHRAGHHQRHHQGGQRPAAEGLLHAGPRRARHGVARNATATAASPARSVTRTTRVEKLTHRAAGRGAGRCRGGGGGGTEDRLLRARSGRAQEVSRQAGQAAARARSARQGRRSRRSPT